MEDVLQVAMAAVRVAGSLALVILGIVYRRWAILALGIIALGASALYVSIITGAIDGGQGRILAASGVLQAGIIVACLWATLSSRANVERLWTLLAGSGRRDPDRDRGTWQP